MFVTISCNGNLDNVGCGWDIISWNGCLTSLGSNWGFAGPSWYVELVNIFSNATSDNFSEHGNMSGIIVANGSDTIISPLILLWHLGTTVWTIFNETCKTPLISHNWILVVYTMHITCHLVVLCPVHTHPNKMRSKIGIHVEHEKKMLTCNWW
jgi:hypothetical protein